MAKPLNSDSKGLHFLQTIQYIALIGFVLYFGQALFIPLSFATLTAFILYPICKWLENKKLPRTLAITIALLGVIILVGSLLLIIIYQFHFFLKEWPMVYKKLCALVANASNYLLFDLHLPVKTQSEWLNNIIINTIPQLFPVLRIFIYNSVISFVFLILVPFFAVLILYHREHFTNSLVTLFPASEKENIFLILKETVVTFYNFVRGMITLYIIVGILNVTALLILGIPHAVLFGILVALLTFIPYLGITLGSLLPITMAWLTYDSLWYPAAVILAFTFIQYLEANIIFPLVVSHRLKVNTLFTIISIVAGGILWGAAGMILFVPFVAILKLVADKTNGWTWLSECLNTESSDQRNG